MTHYVTCDCGTVKDVDVQNMFGEQLRVDCDSCGRLLSLGR